MCFIIIIIIIIIIINIIINIIIIIIIIIMLQNKCNVLDCSKLFVLTCHVLTDIIQPYILCPSPGVAIKPLW